MGRCFSGDDFGDDTEQRSRWVDLPKDWLTRVDWVQAYHSFLKLVCEFFLSLGAEDLSGVVNCRGFSASLILLPGDRRFRSAKTFLRSSESFYPKDSWKYAKICQLEHVSSWFLGKAVVVRIFNTEKILEGVFFDMIVGNPSANIFIINEIPIKWELVMMHCLDTQNWLRFLKKIVENLYTFRLRTSVYFSKFTLKSITVSDINFSVGVLIGSFLLA